MSTFTWPPATATPSEQPRVSVAKFGDGYEQRLADGINNSPRSWALTFSRASAEADDILTFLRARNGIEAFDWTDPDGLSGKFVARSWSGNRIGTAAKTINVTFEEVFGA